MQTIPMYLRTVSLSTMLRMALARWEDMIFSSPVTIPVSYTHLGLSVPFLLFLVMGLTLCVPFMGYYYARMYRNQVFGGGISFLHAWIFTVFMYMFAALLAAVAHYIYFRFIDHGYAVSYTHL